MAIPEAQLDTWSKQGAVASSQATYATIKGALEAPESPYATKSYSIFLQGSYGNDTNIYADSDVDVVIRLDSVFYDDLEDLSTEDKATYKAAWSDGGYSFDQFKTGVITQLRKKFGDAVDPGNKAIYVKGNGNRRDADVLPAVEFRKYLSFKSWTNQNYVEGICFWNAKGERIVNYPKQHSANCTTKHQSTAGWFKPSIRIIKNMRNAMISDGYLAEGGAPSYFLEGLLYNVPNGHYGYSFQSTIKDLLDWLNSVQDKSNFVCANEQYYLCHPSSLVTWRKEQMDAFVTAATKYWNNW